MYKKNYFLVLKQYAMLDSESERIGFMEVYLPSNLMLQPSHVIS